MRKMGMEFNCQVLQQEANQSLVSKVTLQRTIGFLAQRTIRCMFHPSQIEVRVVRSALMEGPKPSMGLA